MQSLKRKNLKTHLIPHAQVDLLLPFRRGCRGHGAAQLGPVNSSLLLSNNVDLYLKRILNPPAIVHREAKLAD